jgi:hypothetical protein
MVEALTESVKPRIGSVLFSNLFRTFRSIILVGDSSSLSHFQSLLSKGLANIGAKKNTVFR